MSVENAHFAPKVELISTVIKLMPELKPPVGNMVFFGNGIKLMIVAGPNERRDFHIELGEELFLQIKGDMNVDIINPITHQEERIPVREGEALLLPAGVPHSPQRYADSVGIVFERERHLNESDCLRWYKPSNPADDFSDPDKVLYEEFFHCYDLGTQVRDVIFRYRGLQSSMDVASTISLCGSDNEIGKHSLQSQMENVATAFTNWPKPVSFSDYIKSQLLVSSGLTNIFDSEFTVKVITEDEFLQFPSFIQEVFCWQYAGNSRIFVGSKNNEKTGDGMLLDAGEVTVVSANKAFGEAKSNDRVYDGVHVCFANKAIDSDNKDKAIVNIYKNKVDGLKCFLRFLVLDDISSRMSEIVFKEDETNLESVSLKIDVHTHIIPEHIPNFKEKFGYGGFIHLDYNGCTACNRARMMRDDGTFFREIESNCWDPSIRLAQCDEHEINVQVISTIPIMFSYWAKPEDCWEVCKFLNIHIADIVKETPKRFVGLGSIPMQDVDLAVQELNHIKALGLKGVQIGTNVNQLNLNEPRFLPIFAKCEELNLCVFIHPWDMMGENDMRKYWLPWLVGMPAETSRAICSFIFAGLFDKFPKLRVCFAHAGGSFPGTYARIAHGYDCRPDLCAVDNPIHPKNYIGKFWVDSLAHDEETLDFVVNFFGAENVALGSDYPFPLGEAVPGKLIDSLKHWEKAKKNQLLYKSALAWLDMSEGDFL